MICSRCHGFCVLEELIDDDEIIPVRRCLNCGALSDPLIEAHHHMQPAAPGHPRIVRAPGHHQVSR